MAIIIVDNFQVDINNPIDNRFVVGSQSIPSGSPSLYPTPFYAYKEDIIYKYPGLRIWDFNDNVPYVWDGTQWINENTTGALVQNAATGNTGFQNYVTKFANNQTLLTASSIYDSGTHVGVGLLDTANPNDTSSFGFGNPGQISPVKGFHVAGNIKTNAYFIGYIHADWIVSGTLNLVRIAAPGTPPSSGVYILKNTNGLGSGTSWDLVSNIVPIPTGINLTPTTTSGSLSTGNIFGGLNGSNQYTFKPLISTGLQITDSTNEIRIESKAGVNLGAPDPNSIDGVGIYSGLDTDNIHQFKRIKSSSLEVSPDGSNSIKIEIPSSFEGTDYYVNGYYDGNLPQLGTRSKPFSSLQNCLDKILNRGTFGTSSINNGQPYEKWEIRTGPNPAYQSNSQSLGYNKPCYQNAYFSDLPGYGAIRVIIQSYVEVKENLAIQGVTYFLEKGGYLSHIVVRETTTLDAVTGQPFEYLFDTTPLVNGAPKGNPYYKTNGNIVNNNPGELDYDINCYLEGSGTISFSPGHPNRKGFIKHKATNSYDWLIANPSSPLNTPAVFAAASNFPNQRISYFTIGSIGGYISFNMYPLPAVGVGTPATHISGTVSITTEDGSAFVREGVSMIGYKTISTPDYGLIQVEGRNSMFYQSVFLNGTLVLGANEQHMIYAKDYGSIYSDNGRIYMRRHYQHVLFDSIEYVSDRLDSQAFGSNGLNSPGSYFRVINPTGTTNAQWKAMAQPTSWRNAIGGIIFPTVAGTNAPTTIQAGHVFRANNTIGVGTGLVAFCGKRYLPSTHVHDIYLKNGSDLTHGGDFYTQQNTGATEGGPDTFICLENSIPPTGDTTHPNRYGRSSTFCGIAANGGGYVTNLHYNYYIKSIMHPDYGTYSANSVSFKNLKIDSSIFKGVIRVENYTSGISWNKTTYGGNFKNCYIGNIRYGGTAILPFSNMPIYNGYGDDSQKINIGGTTIDLPGGFINTSIPVFGTTASAISSGLSVGSIYRDTSGNLKMLV